MTWNDHLLELVQTGTFRKQGALVKALAERGFVVHQGSVSRELRSLGVTKVRGVYVVPDTPLGAPLHDLRVTAGGCLVVLRTEPAFASVLAQAIDGADLSGVLGTIAGDDTVFVATSGPEGTRSVARLLDIPLERQEE
jgi:transcriptional regulator of arginine metabolism